MKLNILQKGSYGLLLGWFLVIALVLTEVSNVAAKDYPSVPILSLTGKTRDYNDSWYPDGRIWLPASLNSPREFLLPVFIQNQWHTYEQTKTIYQVDPIYSFQFTVLYDSSALRAVGVQKFGPKELELDLKRQADSVPLAKYFNISWMDDKDWSYKTYLNPNTPYQDYTKGRAIRIVGTSTKPLPNTDLQADEFKILLYVRFRIIPKDGQPWGTAGFTPIYIKNDTIRYNTLNIRKQAPFERLRPEYGGRVVTDDFPDPGEFTGLEGVNNRDNQTKWSIEPHLPGVIYLKISDRVPAFEFKLERGIGQIPAVEELMPELWNMKDPITIDSGSFSPLYGRRVVQLLNRTATSRLLDIFVESDQPWLMFRTVQIGTRSKNPIPAPTQKGYINWIDNGILGDAARGTPIAGRETQPDGDVHIEIRCDPQGLTTAGQNGEAAGIYIGYLTFSSHTAFIDPVKLRITFIYFRNPVEWYNTTKPAGIGLSIRNSKGASGERTNLIFGTGYRATPGVDSLFGEYAYQYDMFKFGARFYPPDNAPQGLKDSVRFGFGDFSSNDEQNRSESRDIRSITDTNNSIIYKVRIKADTVQYYPLVIEWDTTDFPPDAQLFLRDTLNGWLFPAVDMRNATDWGGGKKSYTINDARVKAFLIEYTLPSILVLKDEKGLNIIKKGWNLLSLPRRPANKVWNIVYKNAMNKPYYFSSNQYQDEASLRVGVGYFIKYSQFIDTVFKGAYISEINNLTSGDSIRCYTGWSSIGTVSSPVNIKDIDFNLVGMSKPNLLYVRKYGIWGYLTDRGYVEVSEMRPGLGYWLKVDDQGYLKLSAPINPKMSVDDGTNEKTSILSLSDKIIVRDNAQHEGTLYASIDKSLDATGFELPPAPPSFLFDMRYSNNTYLSNQNTSVIKLNGVEMPILISMKNPSATYTFVDAVTGQVFGTIESGKSADLEIKKASNAIKVLVTEPAVTGFSLNSYPNPVVTTSTVKFAIPESGNVTVRLYDALGHEMATIADGYYTAGEHTATLNAADLASGTYICKIVSGSNSTVQSIRVTK